MKTLTATTIFLSSLLLFLIEPIAAKQLLPNLGGSSAVWLTCLVFFQLALLLGYLYAHCLARLNPAPAATIHLTLIATAVLTSIVTLGRTFSLDAAHPIRGI